MYEYPDRADPKITDLRVNLLRQPWGVSTEDLRFSWVIEGTQQDLSQTAYRILVYDRYDGHGEGHGIFDSGWVDNVQSSGVPAPGLSRLLTADAVYYWQIRVRMVGGEELASPVQIFTTAKGETFGSAPGIWWGEEDFLFLRHEFSVSTREIEGLDAALLTVTAASPEPTRQFVYNAYINGTCHGVGPTRMGKTPKGEKILYYHTYDVRPSLCAGRNCLSAICYAIEGRAFLCELTLHFSDGTSRSVTNSSTDREGWRAFGGDAVFGKDNSIGTHYFTAHANNVDMTRYPAGFSLAGYDDGGWSVPDATLPMTAFGRLLPDGIAPVTRYLHPADDITEPVPGCYVADLGNEIVGGVRLELDLPAPCTVTLRFGEQRNPDGTVKYRMNTGNVYTETWHLIAGKQTVETLDLMTYRYVQIEGCPVAITSDMLIGLEIRAPFDGDASEFSSDSTLLNDFYALTKYTVKATTQDLFVDSQSRERGAYEGDLLINLMAAAAHSGDYGVGRLTVEYLCTHRTWPAEYILLVVISAWELYMLTGDDSTLRKWYPHLREKTFTDRLNPDVGLIDLGNIPSSTVNSILVDWPHSERDGYDMSVAYNTVLNAMAARAYRALSRIAYVTGHTEDGKTFAELSNNVRNSLICRVYDANSDAFRDGLTADGTPSPHLSQHATAYALACGIYTDGDMAERLAASIRAQGKIRMSVYGAYFLLMGLYDTGHGDVANGLLLDPDISRGARTWAYMRYVMNATITTEAWNQTNKPNMTLSHPWGAAPAHAITGGIFGVRPTAAGFASFDVTLQTHGLTRASLRMPTVKGAILLSFEKGDGLTLEITVPPNTAATVRIPRGYSSSVTADGSAQICPTGCIPLRPGRHVLVFHR